jgi:hypothetical protein
VSRGTGEEDNHCSATVERCQLPGLNMCHVGLRHLLMNMHDLRAIYIEIQFSPYHPYSLSERKYFLYQVLRIGYRQLQLNYPVPGARSYPIGPIAKNAFPVTASSIQPQDLTKHPPSTAMSVLR